MNKDKHQEAIELEMLDLAHRKEAAESELESAKGIEAIKDAQARDMAGYTDSRDLMNRLIGQAEMARSLAKFADIVSLSKLAYIKENKLYQTLKGKSGLDREGEPIADIGTWAGFCRCLGVSASKVDEDLSNLKFLGEEALESLHRVGAGYRDIRKLRKLSSEDQERIIAEAKVKGDKEDLVDLIDELAAKHAREKSTLEGKLARSDRKLVNEQADLERSKDKVAELENRITSLTETTIPLDEDEESALRYIESFFNQAHSVVNVLAFEVMKGSLQKSSLRVKLACISFAEYLEKAGIALNTRIRNDNPDIWDIDGADESEVDDAEEAESAAREKLKSQLPISPLS